MKLLIIEYDIIQLIINISSDFKLMSLLDMHPSPMKSEKNLSKQSEAYKYLKSDESLVLSEPMIIDYREEKIQPQPRYKFMNFVSKQKAQQIPETQQLLPLQDRIIELQREFLLVLTENIIKIYRYSDLSIKSFQKQLYTYTKDQITTQDPETILKIKNQFINSQKLILLHHIKLQMQEVRSIKVFKWTWAREKALKSSDKDKPKILHIITEDSESKKLELIAFDTSRKKLYNRGIVQPPTFMLCWSFVFHNEVIVWANDMNLYHYLLSEEGFKCIRSIPSEINPKRQLYEFKEVQKQKKISKSVEKKKVETKNKTRQKSQSKPMKNERMSLLDYFLPQKLPPQPQEKKQIITLTYEMNYCNILGYRDLDQEKVLPLFFTLYNREFNILKVKCVQIIYPLKSNEEEDSCRLLKFKEKSLAQQFPTIFVLKKTNQIISHNTACPELIDNVLIEEFGNSFYLKLRSQMIFLEKKYDHYYAVDSLEKINKSNNLFISQNSNLLASHNPDSSIIEINELTGISINQSNYSEDDKFRLRSKMIDFIDLRYELKIDKNTGKKMLPTQSKTSKIRKKLGWFLPEKSVQEIRQQFQFLKKENQISKQKFLDIKIHKFWINKILNRYDFYFVIEIQNEEMKKNKYKPYLCLYKGHKFDKQQKILDISQECNSEEELIIIQQLGKIIGVSETNFYFNLWKQSPKTIDDIRKYLLPCKDFIKIAEQLQCFLKRKPMYITQLLNILKYLLIMLQEKIKKSITQQDLKQYFISEFMYRKLMFYDSNYLIDEKQFKIRLQKNLLQAIDELVNETLHPKTKKVSVWQQQEKAPPNLQLIVIFHLFKFPLLEDYPWFLNFLFERHENELIQLLKNFPYILPKYPYFTDDTYNLLKNAAKIFRPNTNPQKIAQDLVEFKNLSSAEYQKLKPQGLQQGLFSTILPKHFLEQSAFIQNFLLLFDQEYSNTFLYKMINDIFDHQLQDSKGERPMIKFTNIMLIKKSISQFVEDLRNISKQNLHIYTLEYFIKKAYKRKQKADIQSMIQIYKQNYDFPEQLLKQMKLRAGLYELIITNQILLQQNVTLTQVMNTPIQKWIALFFLGNKEQKKLLCTDFKKLYNNYKQYTEAISQYVKSEHCSKIQLSIMSQQIAKLSEEEQLESQSLIQVIINGFCEKIHLQDTADCKNFLYHINQLHFTPDLLFKIDRIQKFKLCLRVFQVFYMEDKTLYQLLNNTHEIIKEMMEAFFTGELRREQVPINRSFISIEQCEGMWDLLCYLKDSVFFDISTQELLIAYCKKMIQWQRFTQVSDLLYNSDRIRTPEDEQEIKPTKVCKKIIQETIQSLYQTQNLLFDQNVKGYIRNILLIEKYPQFNQTIIKQKAKLNLVDLLQSWNYQVALMDLQSMCNQWQACKDEAKNQAQLGGMYYRPVMIQIIEKYGKHLDLNTLEQIYGGFMTATEAIQNPPIKTDQFYNYCSKLSEVLMGLNQLKQASSIICTLNQKFLMNYPLMTECMLKSLVFGFEEKFKNLCKNDKQYYEEESEILEYVSSSEQNILNDDSIYEEKVSEDKIKKQESEMIINNFFKSLAPKEKKLPNQSVPTKSKIPAIKIEKWKCVPTKLLIIHPHHIHLKYEIDPSPVNLQKQSPTLCEEHEFHQKLKYCWKIKKYIEYFVLNWIAKKQDKLNIIFQEYFQNDITLEDKIQIVISQDLTFKNHRHKIFADQIWNAVVFGVSERVIGKRNLSKKCQQNIIHLREQTNVQELTYCYFLLLMGLASPKIGIQLIEYISYQHQASVKMFSMFQRWCDTVKDFFCIDYFIIFKLYLNSLTKLLVVKYEGQGFLQYGSDNPYIMSSQGHSQETGHMVFNKLFKQMISQNLQLFRRNLKDGFYRDDPLHGVVLKMAELTNKAKKRNAFRQKIYTNFIQTTKFNLYNHLKKVQREQSLKEQAEKSSEPSNPILNDSMKQYQNSVCEDIKGMRLEDFRRMKKKIMKEQKSKISRFSDDSNQLTERSVVHEIMRHLSFNSNNTSMNIPNLHNQAIKDSVAETLKQIYQQKQDSQNFISDANTPPEYHNLTMPVIPVIKKVRGQKIKNLDQFIKIINGNDYSIIDFWSPDAIFLETNRCYQNEKVSFIQVITMFHDLMVGNHNKINIIYSSLPDLDDQPLKVREILLKKLFPLKYLNRDFYAQYSKSYDELCSNIKPVIHEATIQQIIDIGWIINRICELQYRKVQKHDWRFILAEVALERVGRKGVYDEHTVKRIFDLVLLFQKLRYKGQQFVKDNFSVIYNHFLIGGNEYLVKSLEDAIKTLLNLNIEELKSEANMKKVYYKKSETPNSLPNLNEDDSQVFKETDSFIDS